MKRKIIMGIITAVLFVSAAALLMQNKNTMSNRIKKDDIASYPVTTEEVKYTRVNRQVKFVGTAEAYNDIELISETQGKVIESIVENGSKVGKGAILARVDDELLRASFKLAQSGFEKAEKDNERYEALYKEKNISLNDVENSRISLKSAEAQYIIARKYLDNSKITSPINGIVTKRYINTGSTVAPGTPIANIVDISRIKINISIPENDIKRITKEMKAAISSTLYPEKVFFGRVASVGVKADDSHNYPVEIVFLNNGNIFNAGMYVDVSFDYISAENHLTIPRGALLGSIKAPQVYVALNGKALLKNIVIYGIEGESVLVKSGVNEGDKIILSGKNNVENGSEITIINK